MRAAGDPRDHALTAFGGAAGQVACQTARRWASREILCPRYASVLSAWGIGQAEVTALRQAGLEAPLDPEGLDRAAPRSPVSAAACAALADQLLAQRPGSGHQSHGLRGYQPPILGWERRPVADCRAP